MKDQAFSSVLFSLFDRQLFEEDQQLAALIRDTEQRWGEHMLSDDALYFVSAAGEAVPHRLSGGNGEDDL